MRDRDYKIDRQTYGERERHRGTVRWRDTDRDRHRQRDSERKRSLCNNNFNLVYSCRVLNRQQSFLHL